MDTFHTCHNAGSSYGINMISLKRLIIMSLLNLIVIIVCDVIGTLVASSHDHPSLEMPSDPES